MPGAPAGPRAGVVGRPSVPDHRPSRRAPHAADHEGADPRRARHLPSHRGRDSTAPQRATDEAAREAAHERAALLTPIAKAWSTDIGVEVASLGVQVHGGMGFIEETGAAQHYRDARIAPIYEGTNGIQAIDLVGRKLPMAGGAVVQGLSRRDCAARSTRSMPPTIRPSAATGARLARRSTASSAPPTWLLARCDNARRRARRRHALSAAVRATAAGGALWPRRRSRRAGLLLLCLLPLPPRA